MKLIDKDALVAEIEKRLKELRTALNNHYSSETESRLSELERTFTIIVSSKQEHESEVSFKDSVWADSIDDNFETHLTRFYYSNLELIQDCSRDDKEVVGIIAKHFAQWQKEQMMKDAVDGEVNVLCTHISFPKVLPSELSKQRVKVIIIKE